jgi:hypothetical protein
MIKYITVLAAASALAGPAAAQSLKVSLVGKDPATIQADISRAANIVCFRGARGPLEVYSMRECVANTVKDAEARVPALAAKPAALEKVASTR